MTGERGVVGLDRTTHLSALAAVITCVRPVEQHHFLPHNPAIKTIVFFFNSIFELITQHIFGSELIIF